LSSKKSNKNDKNHKNPVSMIVIRGFLGLKLCVLSVSAPPREALLRINSMNENVGIRGENGQRTGKKGKIIFLPL